MRADLGEAFSVRMDDPSRVGEARRRASAMAARLGFDANRQATAALVAAEAATNLARHAQAGELIFQGRREGNGAVLELTSCDRGPGMIDVNRCLSDGYSTAGSLGTGLGAIARLADSFRIHSIFGEGTVLWARIDSAPTLARERVGRPEASAIVLPAEGEEACGDALDLAWSETATLLLVSDGLGHGPAAAEASSAAVEAFRERRSDDPVAIIEAAHDRLRGTRGAAMAVARLDPSKGSIRYAGIGNIAGVVFGPASGRSAHMISQHGTVGHSVRKSQANDYAWPEGATLIVHSDGLSGRWDLGRVPSLCSLGPGVLAGLLHRDHRRRRDDVTVFVARRDRAVTSPIRGNA